MSQTEQDEITDEWSMAEDDGLLDASETLDAIGSTPFAWSG